MQDALRPLCLFTYLFAGGVAAAPGNYLDLSLDELLDVPVAVASRKAVSQRVAPGILTVIEGDDIRRSGARDLVDVLRQVPGFDFRLIVSNILGLGVRGHIGSDGRVLLLVDGIEANEQRFGTAQFGLKFPVESIHRIEIVRGSALAMYGGTAELGVINIITRDATELSGMEVGVARGVVGSGAVSRDQWTLSTGMVRDDFKWSAVMHRGRSLRSDQTFQGVNGTSYDMGASDSVEPEIVNLGVAFGPLQVRYQSEDTDVRSRYAGAGIQPAAWTFRQRAESVLASLAASAGNDVTVSGSLLRQKQSPRETTNSAGVITSQTQVQRTQAKLGLDWAPSLQWHLATGLDVTDTRFDAIVRSSFLGPLAYNQLRVSGIYGEVMHAAAWGDITVGARRDQHQYAGDLASTRVAYTRTAGNWHGKLLASQAQRAPSLEDYSSGMNGLRVRLTEKVRTFEAEMGYRLDAETQLSINVFDILTRDTLILRNNSDVRTKGLESSLHMRRPWGKAEVSLSLYNAQGTDTLNVSTTDLLGTTILESNAVLGFSPWKLSASGSYFVKKDVALSPSVVVYGPRWAYDAETSNDMQIRFRQFPTSALANLALQLENWGTQGLTLTLGLYNMLGAKAIFAAPIRNSTPPVPDLGPEAVAHVRYRF